MKTVIGAVAAVGLAAAAHAQPQSLYFENFEGGPIGPEWSANSGITQAWPAFTNFNGRYSGGYTRLTLTQPNGGQPGGVGGSGDGGGGGGDGGGAGQWLQYTATFDFYAIDSWDGSNQVYGEDHFKIAANGVTIFDETFGNQPGSTQTFRAPDIGGTNISFDDRWNDSIYRQISVAFTVPMVEPLTLTWFDGGLQGLADESWGIDNVRITYETVPAPGAAGLAGCALALLRRRR